MVPDSCIPLCSRSEHPSPKIAPLLGFYWTTFPSDVIADRDLVRSFLLMDKGTTGLGVGGGPRDPFWFTPVLPLFSFGKSGCSSASVTTF